MPVRYNSKFIRATFGNKRRLIEYVQDNKYQRISRWAVEVKKNILSDWEETFNTDNSKEAADEFTSTCNKYR